MVNKISMRNSLLHITLATHQVLGGSKFNLAYTYTQELMLMPHVSAEFALEGGASQHNKPTLVLSLMPLWALELRCRVLMTPSGGGAFTMAELTIWGIHRKSSFLGTCRQWQTGVGKHES